MPKSWQKLILGPIKSVKLNYCHKNDKSIFSISIFHLENCKSCTAFVWQYRSNILSYILQKKRNVGRLSKIYDGDAFTTKSFYVNLGGNKLKDFEKKKCNF